VHTLLRAVKPGERSMVFCDQKYKVRRLAAKLGGETASVGAITGNHSQAQRERTLGAFRAGRLTSLVATDVAARGLDIPDVAQVIHYELPVNPTSYVHRAGRTGRAEKEGATFLILSQEEERHYLRMVRQLKIQTRRLSLPELVALPAAAMPRNEAPVHRPSHHTHDHQRSPSYRDVHHDGASVSYRSSFRRGRQGRFGR
jgi:ATP-dependent RNA helicase RhlE